MSKEQNVIKTVQDMLSTEEFISKDDLLDKIKLLGWKPVTLNFALSKLQKANAVEIKKENDIKSFKLIKKINGDIMETTNKQQDKYYARKKNYRRTIKELTPEQADFKEKVNTNRDFLFDKEVTWVSGEGIEFPLKIAGMGDITLRCRFFINDFMASEEQTGALVYIPWDDERISQLFDQVDDLLSKEQPVQRCVNFGVAPAK